MGNSSSLFQFYCLGCFQDRPSPFSHLIIEPEGSSLSPWQAFHSNPQPTFACYMQNDTTTALFILSNSVYLSWAVPQKIYVFTTPDLSHVLPEYLSRVQWKNKNFQQTSVSEAQWLCNSTLNFGLKGPRFEHPEEIWFSKCKENYGSMR